MVKSPQLLEMEWPFVLEMKELQEENEALKKRISELEIQMKRMKRLNEGSNDVDEAKQQETPAPILPPISSLPLDAEQISRYGRQLIMSEIGMQGIPLQYSDLTSLRSDQIVSSISSRCRSRWTWISCVSLFGWCWSWYWFASFFSQLIDSPKKRKNWCCGLWHCWKEQLA